MISSYLKSDLSCFDIFQKVPHLKTCLTVVDQGGAMTDTATNLLIEEEEEEGVNMEVEAEVAASPHDSVAAAVVAETPWGS